MQKCIVSEISKNKKVLLREHKRHTACRVVSTPSVVLPGYPPGVRVPPGGVPDPGTPPGGVPDPGTPRGVPDPGTHPRGVPDRVPPRGGPGTPHCLMAFWEMLQSIMGYGYPPCGQTESWMDRRVSKHYLPPSFGCGR